jgi:hypothetical protein
VLVAVEQGTSLKCYVCVSTNIIGHQDCAADVPPDQYLLECQNGENYCKREQAKAMGIETLTRNCSTVDVNQAHKCTSFFGMETCMSIGSCATDGCNHSNSNFVVNKITMVLTAAGVLYLLNKLY